MDEMEEVLTALQLGDSFFPSGAFAHSCGLETFVSDGAVLTREHLAGFIESYLLGLVAHCDAVFVRCSHLAGREDSMDDIGRLDDLAHAMKPSYELRAASLQMGRQMARIAEGLYTGHFLARLVKAVTAGEVRGHHPVIFGAVCGSTGIDPTKTLLTYLYSTVSSLVSAGLRLAPIGHLDGQRTIESLRPLVARIAKEAQELREEDISAFAPCMEARAMRHENLETRLFKS